jgi:hypothetical protein
VLLNDWFEAYVAVKGFTIVINVHGDLKPYSLQFGSSLAFCIRGVGFSTINISYVDWMCEVHTRSDGVRSPARRCLGIM